MAPLMRTASVISVCSSTSIVTISRFCLAWGLTTGRNKLTKPTTSTAGLSRLSYTTTLRAGNTNNNSMSVTASNKAISSITGMPLGPYAVGVTTVEVVDEGRVDPGDPTQPRRLQTELWYPASPGEANKPKNTYLDFLGGGVIPGSVEAANDPRAMGGYRDGLTIQELDEGGVWRNDAVRDAVPYEDTQTKFPLVLFSHGSGAFRASYIYWTEFLASHGYVVAAPDHPGSARYTQIHGEVVTPYTNRQRSQFDSMERERPHDMISVMNGVENMGRRSDDTPPNNRVSVIPTSATTCALLAPLVDTARVAVTGMSFGGYTAAATVELRDERVRSAVLQCPSLYRQTFAPDQRPPVPVMVMLGAEDTVIGNPGNDAARRYVDHHPHPGGESYLLELVNGGHVSFTSCEIYNPEYGNGIAATTHCPGLTRSSYRPLDIVTQHGMINTYGLAFLNRHLKPNEETAEGKQLLEDMKRGKGPFPKEELIVRGKL